jgi:hypothetical protein
MNEIGLQTEQFHGLLQRRRKSSFLAWLCVAGALLSGAVPAAWCQKTEAQEQMDQAVSDAINLLSGLAHGGEESPALPLIELLRKSDELICGAWKISGYVLLRDVLLANPNADPQTIDALQKLNAKIEAACEEHSTSAHTGGSGGTSPPPPPPPPPPKTPEEMADAICARQCKPAFDAYMSALEAKTDAGFRYFQTRSGEDLAAYKDAIKAWEDAKAAYYACLKKCYNAAVGAHAIGQIPGWVQDYAVPKTPGRSSESGSMKSPKLEDGTSFRSVMPAPGTGSTKTESAYLPPIAGPGGTIVATVTDTEEAGPHGVIVGTVDDQGRHKYFETITDSKGKVAFLVPAAVTSILLFRHFDPQGNPSNAATTQIGATPHLPESEPLPANRIPSQGPAITEGNSVIDTGAGGQGAIRLHTRGADPLTTRVLVDGKELEPLSASDTSVTARLPQGTALGSHRIGIQSGGVKSNSFTADVVKLVSDPVGPMHSGSKATVVVHVEGVPVGQKAMMHFEVSGAAKLRSGSEAVDVPIRNGAAQVEIEGVHPGELRVKYVMSVQDLWSGDGSGGGQ